MCTIWRSTATVRKGRFHKVTLYEITVTTLAELAGPLGPFSTPEERERDRQKWLAQLGEDHIPVLTDLLLHPPSSQAYRPATWDQFEMELLEALGAVGRRNPPQVLALLASALYDPRARPTVITAVGLVGSPAGLPILRSLSQHADLGPDELVRLACALGEIGGNGAREALERLQLLDGAKQIEVADEIEIALHNIRTEAAEQD